MTGGVGVGIKSKWLRTDVTFDYLAPLKYNGTIARPATSPPRSRRFSALFNGYLDLGTWYRMTPYIGAGAGVAYCAPPTMPARWRRRSPATSHQQWNFAWAAMAGLAYTVAPNLRSMSATATSISAT